MKTSLEVTKNSEGRIESGILFKDKRKTLEFVNRWDDDGFLRNVEFKGRNAVLPTTYEALKYLNDKFIERIRRIDLIDEITNIASIDLIDSISSITNIDLIKNIRSANIEGYNNIVRNPRFDDDVNFWTIANGAILDAGFYCDHSIRLGNGADAATAYQFLAPFYANMMEGGLRYRCAGADVNVAVVYISYIDGTNTNFALNGTANAWLFLNLTGLSVKKIAYILLLVNAPYIVDFTQINLIPQLTAITGTVAVASLPASNVALGLHENQTYIPAHKSTNANAALWACTTVGRIHQIYIQAAATVEGDIYTKSGGTAMIHFKLQDREGIVLPFLPYPAYYVKSPASGDDPYVTFTTAGQCYFTFIYTENAT